MSGSSSVFKELLLLFGFSDIKFIFLYPFVPSYNFSRPFIIIFISFFGTLISFFFLLNNFPPSKSFKIDEFIIISSFNNTIKLYIYI